MPPIFGYLAYLDNSATPFLQSGGADGGGEMLIIPFHRDATRAVVNCALNEPPSFEGGQIAFVCGDELVSPARPTGSATAHTCATVHGVQRLTSGVRYNLFVAFELDAEAGALAGAEPEPTGSEATA